MCLVPARHLATAWLRQGLFPWLRRLDKICVPNKEGALHTSAKINISYSILFNLTTSYSSYFGGKKGISRNKTSFFLLMQAIEYECTVHAPAQGTSNAQALLHLSSRSPCPFQFYHPRHCRVL